MPIPRECGTSFLQGRANKELRSNFATSFAIPLHNDSPSSLVKRKSPVQLISNSRLSEVKTDVPKHNTSHPGRPFPAHRHSLKTTEQSLHSARDSTWEARPTWATQHERPSWLPPSSAVQVPLYTMRRVCSLESDPRPTWLLAGLSPRGESDLYSLVRKHQATMIWRHDKSFDWFGFHPEGASTFGSCILPLNSVQDHRPKSISVNM